MVDGGKQPYSYQWQYKNPKLPDFKNSIEKGNTTNVLEPPVESDISYYRCIITDADGDKVTSNTAKVEKKSSGVNIDDLIDPKVPLALKITKEPEDATGKVGETARLVVGVQGGRLPLRYQWQYTEYNYGKFQYTGIYQDSKAKGNTTAVLELPIENDPCGYRCVITDADGYSVTSRMAEVKKKDDIEILPSPLKITRQPEKYKIVNDEPFEISLDATVLPGTIKYQWQRKTADTDWVDLTPSSKYQGADTNRMIVSDQGKGTVDFRCVVTSGSQTLISNTCRTFNNPQGTAAGNKPPVFYYITQDVKGKTGTFTVKADGLSGHNLKYQWTDHFGNPNEDVNNKYIEVSGTNTATIYYKVKGGLLILDPIKCVIRCETDGGQVETNIIDIPNIIEH
ncbi:hypothetical protein HMPREF1142_1692 [Peptostreptococcaceae bacterium AS15]|nr:hypothetical protein HMPREF1142_1692 [Peptostreptococcaceae bacterium AS15]